MKRRARTISDISELSAEQYLELISSPAKRTKYGAKKGERDGFIFDSQLELARYDHLKQLQTMGAISGLEVHPRYRFTGSTGILLARYTPDFQYRDINGALVVEDVKGAATISATYIRNCRTLWDRDRIMVQTVTRKRGEWLSNDSFSVPRSVVTKLHKGSKR